MNLIVVVDSKWGIGKNNGLLFRLKKDMKFFRETTIGKAVVMGAKTFDSFKNGALPERVNIVLDDKGRYHAGAVTVTCVEELDKELEKYSDDELFVIGGASVYKLLLDRCSTAYVTKAEADGNAELFFPNLDELPNWKLVSVSEAEDDCGYSVRFCKYVNKNA